MVWRSKIGLVKGIKTVISILHIVSKNNIE